MKKRLMHSTICCCCYPMINAFDYYKSDLDPKQGTGQLSQYLYFICSTTHIIRLESISLNIYIPRLFLLNSGMGRPIREANSPITLSLTTSMRSMFGLEVPDLRPIKGLDGIILKKKNMKKYQIDAQTSENLAQVSS